MGEGAPGGTHHLQRAGNAGGVGGVERGGALRVLGGEGGVGFGHRQLADGVTDFGGDGGDGGDAIQQGADIKSRSADQYRHRACRMGAGDFRLCRLGPIRR